MPSQTIYASVNSDGTIKTQSGVRSVSAPSDSSVYEVEFETPFNNFPCAVVTQNYPDWDATGSNGGDTRDNAVIVSLTTSNIRIKTGGSSGSHSDRNFCVIIMGV